MNSVVESLERHEHAGHSLHGEGEHGLASGAQAAALVVAMLAAGLAIAEQGARHAEIRLQQRSIDATDAWAQFQAKSTRGTVARDIAALAAAMSQEADQAAASRREALIAKLNADAAGYDDDPTDGRKVLAKRAHDLEHSRDHATEQTHAYHNGSAAYQLGIVLATASVITRSRMLLIFAALLGVAGVVLSILGYVAPQYGAF